MPQRLPEVAPLLDSLTTQLAERLRTETLPVTLVGIRSGGEWLAQSMAARLNIPAWAISPGYFRDDVHRSGLHPEIRPTYLPDSLEGHVVWLVDDVLHTGRTVRAALNELFEYGRPAAVRLAVLIDRPGRELPIHADVAANTLDLPADCQIKLIGPAPLQLVLRT